MFKVLAAFGAGDGHDVGALRVDPREGDLRRSISFLARDRVDAFDQFEVFVEVLGLKARIGAAPIDSNASR